MKAPYFSIFALAFGLVIASCETKPKNELPQESTADTAVLKERDDSAMASNDATADRDVDWDNIKLDLPDVKLPEINTPDINLRGDDKQTVYSLGENVLFETGSATIRPAAQKSLQQVAASLQQRYADGRIRVYGYADAVGEKDDNKDLSEQRAEAVRQWLISEGKVTEANVSVHPKGEKNPVASNETAAGRQQNRRVEIVAVNR